jgi:hypothetical protein
MIEWGINSNAGSSITSNNDYFWLWNNANNSFNIYNNTVIELLPSVSYPRLVSLNIFDSPLSLAGDLDIFFFINQSNLSTNTELNNIGIKPDFQCKRGMNILNWEYSGSLHAILHQSNINSFATVTIRSAIRQLVTI